VGFVKFTKTLELTTGGTIVITRSSNAGRMITVSKGGLEATVILTQEEYQTLKEDL
jgi:PHD/YefM family antitoxin component YafN of YafNO toxin-antitoxin module